MESAAVQVAAVSGMASAIRRRRYGGTKLHLAGLSVDVMVLAYRPPPTRAREAGPQKGPQVSSAGANRSSSGSGSGGTVTSKA